jgi:cytochrome c553
VSRARIATAVACFLAVVGGVGATATAEDNARGQALYALCAQCHGPDAKGMKFAEAPALAGLPAWYIEAQIKKFQDRQRGEHVGDITGLRMAPMSRTLRSDEDVAAVATYISDLPAGHSEPLLEGGDAAKGKDFYTTCAACHGADAMGNQQMSSPPLKFASDWYLYRTLEKFRSGVRGSNPADPTGAMMRPMALTLPDEQAIKDVVAYINSMSQ